MPKKEQNTPLLPVYLINGEDELKKEQVLKRLHSRLEREGDLSFNSNYLSGETCSGDEITSAVNMLPFASKIRLVQIGDVDKLKREALDTLIDYLRNPLSSTVLALIATKVTKNSRLYKAVCSYGSKAYIDCSPVKKNELNTLVRKMALAQGVTFSSAAAATLIDLVGTNTISLDNEIKKISLAHRGDDPVNQNEVIGLVARTNEVKPWEFVDAFGMRNLKRCIYLYNRMESTSPYGLLTLCVARIRDLLSTKALEKRGALSELAKVVKIPSWKSETIITQSHQYSSQELVSLLDSACDIELAMKSGEDPSEAFLNWIITSVVRPS